LGNSYRLRVKPSPGRGHRRGNGTIRTGHYGARPDLQPLEEAKQIRYLTQAFEYLGSTYQWRAYTHILDQDYEGGRADYERAWNISTMHRPGGRHQDLIVKNDIVSRICQPRKESIQRRCRT
jgi:hypothetical protein